jgi:uncharacterized surface protein with fasciclin (FAS1) repeats
MRSRTQLRALTAAVLGVTLAVGALGGAAGASPGTDAKKPATVIAIAKSNADFSTLVEAVGAAGLVKALKAKGPFTVFAPTNEGFAKVPAADLEALIADKEALSDVLTYHVIKGKILAGDLKPKQKVKTLMGEKLTIRVADDGTATITDANGNTVNIVTTDLKAKNGIVHVIDGVLTPAG